MFNKCYVCGKILFTTYYIDWGGHKVCSECAESTPRCVCCGQFCDSNSIDVGTGERLCTYCQQHYMKKKDCARIVRFINRIYSKSVIGEIHNWKLKVMDAPKMLEVTGSPRVRGLAEKRGDIYTVYIFRQLSKVQFANVLAHELLHIWMYNRKLDPPPEYCEGFCNLGSYIVLSNIDIEEAKMGRKALMQSDDPIYGEGFRICKLLYEEGGWPKVINEIKRLSK